MIFLILILVSFGCSEMNNADDDKMPSLVPDESSDDDDDDNDNDNDDNDDDDAEGTTGRFDLEESDDFYALPFPINTRLDQDGKIRIDDFPNPRKSAILRSYINVGQRDNKGFGANAGVFFSFTGEIDPSTLPQSDADSIAANATAFIVSINPESPDYGMRYPFRFKYSPEKTVYGPENLLVMLPVQGIAMHHNQTYAAVITTDVKDIEGNYCTANKTLQKVLFAESDYPDAENDFWLLGEYLADSNIPLEGVVVATVFTTEDPISRMVALRDHIYQYDLPGIQPGTLHFESEETDYYFISAEVTFPIYQEGVVPYILNGGAVKFDAAGVPIVQWETTTRLALTIPKGDMPANGWPLLIYSHGSGGSWKSFKNKGVANWLAKKGIACASIDAPHHGPRNPISQDSGWESFCFYNALNPEAFRDNNVQAAVELMAVQRQVLELEIPQSLIPASFASGLKDDFIIFEPNDTFFMGHSQGSTVGPLIVAVDPLIRAAFFSGAGASLMWNMLTKLKPFPIVELLRIGLLLTREEADSQLDQFHPALNLIQHIAELVDPSGFNAYFFSRPVTDVFPKDVFQAQGTTDTYVGLQCHGAFAAAARMDIINPLIENDAWERVQLTGGVLLDDIGIQGNRTDYSGLEITSALVQYPEPPSGKDGHYVTFEFPSMHRRVACFFRTWLTDGIAMVVEENEDENAPCTVTEYR